jgi:hypothetical protein
MFKLLDGVYELRIEQDGFLSLPEDLAEGLDFQEKDALALDPGPASVGIESHREFLSALDVVAEGTLRARLRSQFLARPKTVVGAGYTIEIPAELLPLRAGRTARLQVLNRGMTREVYLLRDEANA